MKVGTEGKGHFFTLVQGHLRTCIKIETCYSQKPLGKIATSAFKWENVTMMYTLEIIASCNLGICLLCKLHVND